MTFPLLSAAANIVRTLAVLSMLVARGAATGEIAGLLSMPVLGREFVCTVGFSTNLSEQEPTARGERSLSALPMSTYRRDAALATTRPLS